jgi:hypothetical protein
MEVYMIAVLIIAYLVFAFTGWMAVMKLFTEPDYDESEGLDFSWCECIAFAICSLIPIVNISMNAFWFSLLRRKIKRRPLINCPRISFPKIHWPKCSVAIRAKVRPFNGQNTRG